MLRKVLQSALPTIAAASMYSLYGVVDGIFTGNATGDVGLAAINIVWPLVAIIFAMGIGIGTGGSVTISYYLGRGEKDSAKSIYGSTCTLLVILGILLWGLLFQYENILTLLGASGAVYDQAKSYIEIFIKGSVILVVGSGMLPLLRNMGMAIEAMCCMGLGLVLNVAINYYLLFVVGMGIRGAAIGTLISQMLVVTAGIILLYKRGIFGLHFNKEYQHWRRIIKASITPFGLYLAPSVTLIFTNWQCLKYGGDTVVACYAVISYIVFPVLSILGGVGDGTQPLLSYYYGAGKEKEGLEIRRISYIIIGLLGVIATITVMLLSGRIGTWFGLSADSRAYFSSGMCICACAFVLQGFTKFTSAYLNATMRISMSMYLTFTESLIINPIMLYILPKILGVTGIWMAPIATAMAVLCLYKIQEMKQEQV